jgi:hypothetical protein
MLLLFRSQDLAIALDLTDVTALLATVGKLREAAAAVPRLECFVRDVCEVWPPASWSSPDKRLLYLPCQTGTKVPVLPCQIGSIFLCVPYRTGTKVPVLTVSNRDQGSCVALPNRVNFPMCALPNRVNVPMCALPNKDQGSPPAPK